MPPRPPAPRPRRPAAGRSPPSRRRRRAAAGADRGDRAGLGRSAAALGGTPEILDRYETVRDLNGDGRDDFVTDLADLAVRRRLERLLRRRAAARSPPGCREPGGGYDRFDLGHLRGFAIRDGGGALPALVARYARRPTAATTRRRRAAPAPGASPATRPRSRRSTRRREAARGRRAAAARPSRRRRRLDAAPGARREPGRARRRHRRRSPRSPPSASTGSRSWR